MALFGFLVLLLGLYLVGAFLGAGYRAGYGRDRSSYRRDYRDAYNKTEEPEGQLPDGYKKAAAEEKQGALYPQAA